MDLQKIASTGTAIAVVGTGAVVGGNTVIDQQTGGPERRESEKIEMIRQIVAEEVYLQLINAWPTTSGPVKGIKDPKDYKKQVPK
tara:strand:+ start:1362 stop:1616 length:255 start_codon:yes stop_codon:yes gene_type:complete